MTRAALVFGVGGPVGEATARALADAGWRVTASMRQRRDETQKRLEAMGAVVRFDDLAGDAGWAAAADGCDAVVFTTHLEVATASLERASFACGRVVAFSSNNVAADADAPSYRALAAAEARLRPRFAGAAIVRPTLIYGDPRLPTLTRLLRMARRWPVLPMPGSGVARMQPVFHGDLGVLAAGLAAEDAPAGVFAAGGPDIVSMRELYGAIARAVGRNPVIAPVPRVVLGLAAAVGALSAEQAARAGRDRIAIAQDPIPAPLAPTTSLRDGLAQHVKAMADGSRDGA